MWEGGVFTVTDRPVAGDTELFFYGTGEGRAQQITVSGLPAD